jgi:hypothetical protein
MADSQAVLIHHRSILLHRCHLQCPRQNIPECITDQTAAWHPASRTQLDLLSHTVQHTLNAKDNALWLFVQIWLGQTRSATHYTVVQSQRPTVERLCAINNTLPLTLVAFSGTSTICSPAEICLNTAKDGYDIMDGT